MVKVIGVKFKTSGRIYYFDPLDLDFHAGDGVIVETSRGMEYGDVTCDPKEVDESEIVAPLKPVIRIATDEDRRMRKMYAEKEPEAFAICEQKIAEHGLDMKLVNAEYIFNGSKIVFYFTADERVDFRELVKDLAYSLRTRIELRQIGVRDEAKMLGGLGPCGRPVCCNAFLDDFRPVSIKMAKEQNLSLSPTKISGLCGRLMCCLQYEQNVYESMKKVMPKVGKEINTIDGVGIVVENNAITEKTKVRLTMEDGTIDVREYPYTHLGPVGEPLPEAAQEAAEQKPEGGDEFAAMVKRENGPRSGRKRGTKPQPEKEPAEKQPGLSKSEEPKQGARDPKPKQKSNSKASEPKKQSEQKPKQENRKQNERKQDGQKSSEKQDPQRSSDGKPNGPRPQRQNRPATEKSEQPSAEPASEENADASKKNNRRRRRGRRLGANKPKEPTPKE